MDRGCRAGYRGNIFDQIDLGIFFCGVALAGLVAYLLLGDDLINRRFRNGVVAVIVLPIAFLAVHLPVSYYAVEHGFADAFWKDYLNYWQFIEEKAMSLAAVEPVQPSAPIKFSPYLQPVADSIVAPLADRSTRPLPVWTKMFTEKFGKQRILVFLLYYPVVSGFILALWVLFLAVSGLVRKRPNEKSEALILFIGLASAFSLFPQYFFSAGPTTLERDDVPLPGSFHLFLRNRPSALVFSTALVAVGRTPLDGLSTGPIVVLSRLGLAVPWMGSIGRKKPNEQLFRADNGVLAYVPKDQKPDYEGLYQAVIHNSAPTDWVICYPYAPTVNFMTNRRSYLKNLYVDNASRSAAFDTEAITDIQEKKPAVIVINDDPINATESSRFSVWAPTTLAYIKSHYRYIGTYVRNDVYPARSQ